MDLVISREVPLPLYVTLSDAGTQLWGRIRCCPRVGQADVRPWLEALAEHRLPYRVEIVPCHGTPHKADHGIPNVSRLMPPVGGVEYDLTRLYSHPRAMLFQCNPESRVLPEVGLESIYFPRLIQVCSPSGMTQHPLLCPMQLCLPSAGVERIKVKKHAGLLVPYH